MLLQPATSSVLAIGRGGLGAGFCFCGRRHATQPGCAKPDDPLAPIGVDGILYMHANMCMHVPCMCMELQFLIHTRVTISRTHTRQHPRTLCSQALANTRHGETGVRLPAECVPAATGSCPSCAGAACFCGLAPLCLRLGGGGRDAAALAPARCDVIPCICVWLICTVCMDILCTCIQIFMHACMHAYIGEQKYTRLTQALGGRITVPYYH